MEATVKEQMRQKLYAADWEQRLFETAKDVFLAYKRQVINESTFSSPSDTELAKWSVTSAIALVKTYWEILSVRL